MHMHFIMLRTEFEEMALISVIIYLQSEYIENYNILLQGSLNIAPM